jgi:hypothetical protein
MSVTTSPPAFADPLAEDVLTPPSFTQASEPAVPADRAHQNPIARDGAHHDRIARERAALVAPNVEGHLGVDAIELVRASGLIAAIETVELAGDSHQGLVVDQDPPPGTQMLREGVLTLQVAQAPADAQNTEDDDPATQSHTESSITADEGDEDDTEQWFAELGPAAPPPQPVPARPPRRRRKHRPASAPAPARQLVPDIPPDPLPEACEWPTEEHPSLSPQPAGPGRFASLLIALLVRLPDGSVMPTWRRRALVIAGAILGVLLLTRVGASTSHQSASPSLAQPHVSHPARVALPATAVNPVRNRLTISRRSHESSAPRPDLTSPRHLPVRGPRASIAATAGAADPAPTSRASSSPPSEPASGPFIYLGK